MFRRIDESSSLNRLLQRLSTTMARQRGLPVVVGILLFAAGFILQLVNFAVQSPVLDVVQVILHDAGILVALVGLLMVEPLGR